jgi:GNAT superfamily N-acetyltransferase
MVWRGDAKERRQQDGKARKGQLRSRVLGGTPVGLLGYWDGEPAAWCSIAPKETYRELTDAPTAVDGVWSLVCFFVLRRFRGNAVSRSLLQAAIAYARDEGARIVEAYPVDPDSPSYHFMGFVPLFKAAGFRKVGKSGKRRHIVQLVL